MEEGVTRRLTTIIAADIAGYSRLMGADEEATLASLRAHRKERIDPRIAEHGGRIANTAGDSLLIEFSSVVEAPRCVIDIQHAMAERNRETPEDRRIAFRVGVNVGDVIEQDGDLLGDGVNIAARLEGLAEPGGICLSRAVRDQVRDKMDVAFEDLGEVEVKNIARPLRVFRVVLDDSAKSVKSSRAAKPRWRNPAIAAAIAMLVVLAGAVGWIRPWEAANGPPKSRLVGVAVLPFDNMSSDPAQDYFSDGITEDLITDLSRISGLLVIARGAMFTYKGKTVGAQQIGRDLGVQFVLEGSVRRADGQVRINAQLIDASNGFHIWADRFDRAITGVFAMQDEITQKIVAALAVKLTRSETDRLNRAKRTNPEAYDAFLRGLALLRRYTRETQAEARVFFRRVVELRPGYARAYAAHASVIGFNILRGWSTSPQADSARGLELTDIALRLDDSIPQIYVARSLILRAMHRLDEAAVALRKAIALDRNHADAYASLGITLNYAGRPEEGLIEVQKSMRLNPRSSFFEVWIEAQSYFQLGRYREAVENLQKVVERNPEFILGHTLLAAALAQSGQIEDAQWEAAEILTLEPGYTIAGERKNTPYTKPGLERYLDGLRKAGLPE